MRLVLYSVTNLSSFLYLNKLLEKVKKLLSDLGKQVDEDYYNKTGLLKYVG